MSSSDSDSDIEEQRRQLYPVSQALHPLAPGDDDYNEWPCFLLEDAVVYNKEKQATNLLDVATSGPLIVEGRLHFEEEDELLQSRTRKISHSSHGYLLTNSQSSIRSIRMPSLELKK